MCEAARGAKQSGRTGWSASDDGRSCGAGKTSVKSRETDRENGYENRSPVFSYELSPKPDNLHASNVFMHAGMQDGLGGSGHAAQH